MMLFLTAEEARKKFENTHKRGKIIPTDKYIEKCFLLFKRFLKETGRYWFIMHFIFPTGREKKDFLKDVRTLYGYEGYDFRDILHMKITLGDSYRKPNNILNSYDYWKRNIKPLSESWEAYFELNFPDIEDGDFML